MPSMPLNPSFLDVSFAGQLSTAFQGLVLGFGPGTQLLDVVPGRSK